MEQNQKNWDFDEDLNDNSTDDQTPSDLVPSEEDHFSPETIEAMEEEVVDEANLPLSYLDNIDTEDSDEPPVESWQDNDAS